VSHRCSMAPTSDSMLFCVSGGGSELVSEVAPVHFSCAGCDTETARELSDGTAESVGRPAASGLPR